MAPQPVEIESELTRWFVLRTRSRQEKAVARDLQGRGVAHFLPLVGQVRYYGRNKVSRRVPLFPGYVFLHGSLEQAYEADRSDRVAQLICVADQAGFGRELAQIREALDRGAPLTDHARLEAGQRVVVRSGPWKGLEGLVQTHRRHNRLILQIEALGQADALEIDRDLLDPVQGDEAT